MPSIITPELDAGKLDRRVTLLKPIYLDDTYQDEISGWEAVADVWAAVQPTYGQEMNEGARTVETVTTTIQIRYRTDVDPRWRIRDGDIVFQIKGILDVLRRHVQLQLNCMEVE